jgi:hypothetical protein
VTLVTDKQIGARKNDWSGDREKSCVKNAELNAPSREAGVSSQFWAFGYWRLAFDPGPGIFQR